MTTAPDWAAAAAFLDKTEPDDLTRIWWAVLAERARAEAKHGVQDLPLGIGSSCDKSEADWARWVCDRATARGDLTWKLIIREEVYEAFAESEPGAFVVEAIQAIGTLVAAIQQAVADNPDLTIPPPF